MCPLNKKDNRLRPIAISCVFRRLTGKICCKAVQDTSKNYFQPIQLGFATKQGFESVMHATHTFIEQENQSKYVLVKTIDYANAFNSVKRNVLLQEVKEHVPSLYSFLWQQYSSSSLLFFGNKVIKLQVGCQQGDSSQEQLAYI